MGFYELSLTGQDALFMAIPITLPTTALTLVMGFYELSLTGQDAAFMGFYELSLTGHANTTMAHRQTLLDRDRLDKCAVDRHCVEDFPSSL